MGLRFRKSISIIPGVRLNLSKSGPSSVSLGGKGLTYNIGKRGTRGTVGLPGSGLSYSKYSAYGKPTDQQVIDPETGEITQQKTGGAPWGLILLIAGVILAIYFARA